MAGDRGEAYAKVREALELAFERGDIVEQEGGEEDACRILLDTLDDLAPMLETLRETAQRAAMVVGFFLLDYSDLIETVFDL